MTRYEAKNVIYTVINSGILDFELESDLTEVANCICDDSFEECPKYCLAACKLDECDHAEVWDEELDEFED